MINASSRWQEPLFRQTIEELERRRVTGTALDRIRDDDGQQAPGPRVERLYAALKQRFGEPVPKDPEADSPGFRFLFELARNTTYLEVGSEDGRQVYVDFLTTPLFMRSITPHKHTCRALWLPQYVQQAIAQLKRIAQEAGALDQPAA